MWYIVHLPPVSLCYTIFATLIFNKQNTLAMIIHSGHFVENGTFDCTPFNNANRGARDTHSTLGHAKWHPTSTLKKERENRKRIISLVFE